MNDLRWRFSNETLTAGISQDGGVIINPEYCQILSAQELSAVIFHEQGHVFLNLLNRDRNFEDELACDIYAAERMGFEAIVGALRKIPDWHRDMELIQRIGALNKLAKSFNGKKRVN